MSIENILALTRSIADEIEDVGSDIGDCDPEIWEHLFAEDVLDTVKKYKPMGSAAETDAFRGLYAETKKVIDQALIPSDLYEAGTVLKYDIAPTLVAIAKKNKTVGAEILNDLKTIYMNSEQEDMRKLAKITARKIAKILEPQTEAATVFNLAAVGSNPTDFTGKNIVFTGTLSTMTRKEAADIATAMGAHVANTVSRNTNFLVVGKDAGSKIEKATKLGITVISEEGWNVRIGRNSLEKPPINRPTTPPV
jgi:NAD-dependent DNA ligase